MKKYGFISILALATAIVGCGKQELPYDLAGVEHGVIISIEKKAKTSTTLSTDVSDGDYQMVLSIPSNLQGDYSIMKEAQLQAVYTGADKTKKTAYAVTGITEFPATVKVNMADLVTKLGISGLSVGDRIEFTPSYTLNSGTQVDGWSELGGFNNTLFSGYNDQDGNPFAYRVSYTAFAPFHKEKFQGTHPFYIGGQPAGNCVVTQINDAPPAEWMPKGATAEDLVGLKVEGDIWFEPDTFIMWINTQDFTIILPDQIISPNFTYGSYGTYDGQAARGEGEADTLNNTIWFYFYSIWGPYSFGDAVVEIDFNADPA